MSEAVKVERHGAVAVLRLDDPKAMNALSPPSKPAWRRTFRSSSAMPRCAPLCITGTGKAFCAGGDIRAMQDPEGRKAPRCAPACRRRTPGRGRCSIATSR